MTATVELELDVIAPKVYAVITGSDPVDVIVMANEPIGLAQMALIDRGYATTLGFERVANNRLHTVIPTDELLSGRAELQISVEDLAGNARVVIEHPLVHGLDPNYLVEIIIGNAMQVVTAIGGPYDVAMDVNKGWAARTEVGAA